MQVGWPGLSRAIALSIALTSAFWVALGAWLFHAHINADHGGAARRQASHSQHRGAQGLLSGLTGATRPSSPTAIADARAAPELGGQRLAIPVAGIGADKLVDTFGQSRAAGARHHDAIDIMAPEGTPVLAASSGRVEKLFLSQDGGNTIYVRSPDRRSILYYAHLAAYAPGLHEGQTVRRGERLGTVGHTGNADPTAPHLHFAVWQADPAVGWYQQALAINPYPLLTGKLRR